MVHTQRQRAFVLTDASSLVSASGGHPKGRKMSKLSIITDCKAEASRYA